MTAVLIENEDATKWDPSRKIKDVAAELARLQLGVPRSLDAERKIAEAAREYLHQRDNQDFMLCAELECKRVFTTRYYPRAILMSREDLQAFAYRDSGLSRMEEIARILPGSATRVDSYIYGFNLGSDLGYLEELGEQWHILLGDSSGFFYVPVDAVAAVIRTSF